MFDFYIFYNCQLRYLCLGRGRYVIQYSSLPASNIELCSMCRSTVNINMYKMSECWTASVNSFCTRWPKLWRGLAFLLPFSWLYWCGFFNLYFFVNCPALLAACGCCKCPVYDFFCGVWSCIIMNHLSILLYYLASAVLELRSKEIGSFVLNVL